MSTEYWVWRQDKYNSKSNYSKMSIISNYRVQNYKAMSRQSTPSKKMPIQVAFPIKKKNVVPLPMEIFISLLLKANSIVPPAPVAPLKPSAPPAEMTTRTICVYDKIYNIDLPVGFDIYEGLRRWYPALYEAVIEEQAAWDKTYIPATNQLTDEEEDAMWDHYDYLESLCNF